MPTISTLVVEVETKTSKFSKGLKVATAGLGLLAVGAAYAFKQFEDSDKVAKQTNAVLKSTGGVSKVSAKQVQDLGTALSEKSGIDDEVIKSGENMLLTFTNIRNEVGKGNDIFTQASSASLDMAAAMAAASGSSVDLKGASIQLGKALNDPVKGITALTRVGVSFSPVVQEQIKNLVAHNKTLEAQKIILGEVTKEFGGSAQAQATASMKMGVAFNNLAEDIGKALVPAVNFLLQGLMTLIGFIQANVGPVLTALQTWFANVMDRIRPLVELLKGAAVDAVHQIWGSIQPLIPQLKKWWKEYQPLIKALGLLAGALLYLALKVLPPVIAFYLKFTELTLNAGGVVIGVVTTIIHAFEKMYDFFHHLPSRLKAAGAHMWDWLLDSFRAAINGIISVWNNLAIPGFSHTFDPLGKFGPAQTVTIPGFELPNIPTLATGGMVQRTGLALVHEGERFSGTGGFGNVTVNVYGSVMTENDLAASIQKTLLKTKRRSGALGLA